MEALDPWSVDFTVKPVYSLKYGTADPWEIRSVTWSGLNRMLQKEMAIFNMDQLISSYKLHGLLSRWEENNVLWYEYGNEQPGVGQVDEIFWALLLVLIGLKLWPETLAVDGERRQMWVIECRS